MNPRKWLAVLLMVSPVSAQGKDPNQAREAPRAKLEFHTRFWFTNSSLNRRRSIPVSQVTPPGDVFFGDTIERRASAVMPVFSAELVSRPWLSFDLQYGRSGAGGRELTRQWLHAPDSIVTVVDTGGVFTRPDHEDDQRFVASQSGRIDWFSSNVYFRIADGQSPTYESLYHHGDLVLGIQRLQHKSDFANLERSYNTRRFFSPTGAVGPISGYDADYTAVWLGPHIGVREKLWMGRGFWFDASILWSPYLDFRAKGFNNLAGLRTESPNLEDKAKGAGSHLHVGLSYQWKQLVVEGGFQRLYFFSRTGRHREFLQNGTVVTQQLDYAVAELGGGYTGVSYRF